MRDSLLLIYERLLEAVPEKHQRYLYPSFNLKNRLTGLTGPRGVGKTTLMLQYIKAHHEQFPATFYFSADHIVFKETTIYAFIENLYLTEGTRHFFIDEIHKYDNWSQELKNLYDGFPDMTIVFLGSSSLDLVKGAYDLSRRAKMYKLSGLSFREYLNFYVDANFSSVPFSQLMNSSTVLREVINFPGLLGHFHQYLKEGYYPFAQDDLNSFYEKLMMVIEKTVYEDIANFYDLKTGNLKYFEKILTFLSDKPPGNISINNLAKNLGIDDKTVSNYLKILNETGLVSVIYAAEKGNARMRKPEKVFLNNTNLQYALSAELSGPIEIGTIRELSFIQAIRNASLPIFHSKVGDYEVKDIIFEIGGKNKTRAQLKNIDDAIIVKDDTLIAQKGMIPLWYFGFLY